MSRIFVIVGGLLVLLLTAALVVPPFIDWGGYRADFEREASRILGRPVKVAGDVNARLLPFPSVSFSDVRVGADANHPVMTVDTFSMDAELMPFLRGQLLIFDMRVKRPRVTIALGQDGKVDWAIRPSTPIDPTQIKVERLSVEDGLIIVQDRARNRSFEAQSFNAVMSANSLAGPWQADTNFNLDGQKFVANFNSGEAKSDGSLRVRARILPEAVPASFETDGDVVLTDGRLSYKGDFSLRSSDVMAQQNTARPKTPVEKPFFSDLRVSGKFNADANHFNASEFRMEQGPADNPYVVNGKALLDFGAAPRFEISADGQQIFWGPTEADEGETAAATMPFADRIAIAQRILQQLPVPSIPGQVDLRLPAVIAGGTTIRSVTINAEPDQGDWNIRQFAADLPGRTKVEAKGKLSAGAGFGFTGDMLVASRQPSGLAAWLNEDVDESVRQLEGAGFSGKVELREDMQRIDDLEINLGGSTFKGSLSRQSQGAAQPMIDLNLGAGAVKSDALQAIGSFFASGYGRSFFDAQTLNLSLKAGPVTYKDIDARNVDLAMRLHDGRFDFDRLMISDVADATLTATGTYAPFAKSPSGKLDATILSADLSRFIALTANRHPQLPLFHALSIRAADFPGLFANSEINIIANAVAPLRPSVEAASGKGEGASGKAARPLDPRQKNADDAGEISFSVTGKTDVLKLDLSGTASGRPDAEGGDNAPLQMQLNGTASSEQGEAVLALIGLPSLPLGIAGELTADLTMQGTPGAGMRTMLKLTAPDGTASADGVISLGGNDLAASGKAVVKSADLQPFIATAGYSLPGFGTGLSADLSSDFQFAKGILRFPNLNGKIGDEDVSARLEADFSDSGLPQLKGEAKLASLDMGSLASIMLGQEALAPSKSSAKPTKKSIWSQTAFASRPSLPLLLDMKLNVAEAELGEFGTATDFSARLQKSIDTLNLNELTATWAGGYLSGSTSLRNNDKHVLLTTDMKWSGANLADFYVVENGSAPLGGVVKAAFSINGGGDNMADLVSSLAGSITIDTENFTVPGLDATAFAPMVAAADALSDQPAEANKTAATQGSAIGAIADKAIGQGRFAPGNAQFNFTVVGGVARMPTSRLTEGNAVLSSAMQFDLSTLGIAGNGSFDFNGAAGENTGLAPKLDFTLGGNYDAPEIAFERQPLVQYLTNRLLQREQQRVEAMQAGLMEKQRLRRQLGLFEADAAERKRVREEEARRRAEAAIPRPAVAAPQNDASKLIAPPNGQSINEFLKTLQAPQQ